MQPKNLFDLQGRTAFITGSSRGIGRAIALGLARAGASVVAHGIRRGKDAESLMQELGGNHAWFAQGDLSLPGGGKAVAEEAIKAAGHIDIVILNASVQIRAPWLDITQEEYCVQMQTNFQASLEILQVLTPPMQAKKWGRIMTVGSVQELKPHPQMLVYAASKAAQSSLVLNLSRQLAPEGITVNNLAPGVICTDRNVDSLADEAYAEKVRQAIPAGFFGEPCDCAGLALLLSSEAGRYMTGQNISVDGGMGL
jgi:NAD(P)-dependent dehydrogenase (short-subunit alcohol dehydrogenase family)